MTDSIEKRAARKGDKRQRLVAAAASVLHERGVERTTIADIARAADVPVGNVYYYFKTKDELVEAALGRHAEHLDALTARLDRLADPRERLKSLVAGWVEARHVAARHGCPTGTLAVELDKRDEGGLDLAAGLVIRRLLDWVERQYREMGLDDPDGRALALVGAYQGMSLLSNALRDPEVMTREGARLVREIDASA
ncbi:MULTISPECIES: TetR/AcrR family transcriptional regulator [Streptomyces]|uniref:TetR/AcrR family transcriptional regulator n=1 Tax=Streptomyces TaxID=1883 RepID=UPI0029B2E801|nr:TetR/AcrR family transcriptional regulator [Streptomyces scabiei]MDX3114007.1 TetR/AcrR family transcriptional regulator [Streptomyces scabiei]